MVLFMVPDLLVVTNLEQHLLFICVPMLMKIDPASGDEIWTHENLNSEYALAVVESNDGACIMVGYYMMII